MHWNAVPPGLFHQVVLQIIFGIPEQALLTGL